MRPSEYHAPSSLEDAVRLLGRSAAAGRPLAGGTDLLAQLRSSPVLAAAPGTPVVDLKRIPELGTISVGADGARIGAAVPAWRLTADAGLRRWFPGLAEAAGLIGSAQIQSRATIGGNLCNASPAADTVPPLLALHAAIEIVGPEGARRVAASDFVEGPGRTVLRAGELVVAIHLPAPTAGAADAYLRFIPRNEMDIAAVGVAAWVRIEGARCVEARIALGAVGPRAFLAAEASAVVAGRALDEDTLRRCGAAAAAAASPIDDMRGSIAFRREVSDVLTRRAVALAAARARSDRSP